MQKRWIGIAVVVLACVAGWWLLRAPDVPRPPVAPVVETTASRSPTADAGHDEPDVGRWISPQIAEGNFVATVESEPVEGSFVVGAAGVYPPLRTVGLGIALPTPAAGMDGTQGGTVEVYVRSTAGGHAFWGDVDVAEPGVPLSPSVGLTVRVLNADGTPVNGAAVRVGRGSVGLVLLQETTDEQGRATFPQLPPGEYSANARASGRRSLSADVATNGENVLVLERGRAVSGTVKGAAGEAISGAVVAIHGGGLGSNPLNDVPAEIVTTDLMGQFRATAVPGAQIVVVIHANGWTPAVAASDDPSDEVRLAIALTKPRLVHATVVDPNGRPVPGARVEWADDATGLGATRIVGADGKVQLNDVPPTATVRARLDPHYESGAIDLATKSGERVDLRLTLDVADHRKWRYRAEVPGEVILYDLGAHDGSGARCSVQTSDGRDFTLQECGDGDVTFRARTDRGTVEWTAGKFVDGALARLPLPTSVVIQVHGVENEAWERTGLDLVGPSALAVGLDASPSKDGRTLRSSVYPGAWRLLVDNTRIGAQRFEIPVEGESIEMTVELVALRTIRITTVDAYGAAVTGASVMLFQGDTLVDMSRSAGQLPIEVRVRPPFKGRVLVVDGRRGEGHVAVTEGEEVRVALREEVLSVATPPKRLSKERFAEVTGAKLVSHDRGWLLDFEGEQPGTRAGLKRGDRAITAWPEPGGTRVMVYRRGKGYVDVLVK